jgi:predicted pyridoxine 5'-phosphate oxidase superfamily flavin-nucleotide-binding protein
MDASVLCWLATCDLQGQPNVSPKELFTYSEDDQIIIANIASPQTLKNIKENPKVCVSFIEVFVQKGYQIKGAAKVIYLKNDSAPQKFERLQRLAGDKFNVTSLLAIHPESIKPIQAPSYTFYPETTEAQMIAQAMKAYRVVPNSEK